MTFDTLQNEEAPEGEVNMDSDGQALSTPREAGEETSEKDGKAAEPIASKTNTDLLADLVAVPI